MKLGRRHLIASIVVLALSIAWNVWVFSQPSPARPGSARPSEPQVPLLGDPGAPGGAGPSPAPLDPSAIPAPPALDLSKQPVWPRNPFAHGVPTPVGTPPAGTEPLPPLPVANPVLGAILYSEERKSAIIDGRVVGIGDRVQGGVVLSISRDAVVIQLTSGERLRLGGGRSQ